MTLADELRHHGAHHLDTFGRRTAAQATLDALGAAEGLRTREVSEAVGPSVHTTRQRLARLAALGEVREIGSGPTDPQRRHFRTDG